MKDNKYNEIIDFAIQKECEAVLFYHGLQNKAQFNSQKKILKNFENMEKKHINILKDIKEKNKKYFENIPVIENLKISDYLIEKKFSESSSYQDIIIIAMKKEENSYKLYKDLANKTPDVEIKNLFKKLASEETKHKQHFEKIYDNEILTGN